MLVDLPRGGEGFWPNSSESRATSHAWYAAGGMPLRWRERTGEVREGGWRAVDRAHMLQRRVWVVIHPRRTARKVRSLWVWVGSHPRRTETLWFIYIKVYKHKETKFSEYVVCCFVDKVMKFGEVSIQTARVTGQKVGVCVVLHPRRTGKVNWSGCKWITEYCCWKWIDGCLQVLFGWVLRPLRDWISITVLILRLHFWSRDYTFESSGLHFHPQGGKQVCIVDMYFSFALLLFLGCCFF